MPFYGHSSHVNFSSQLEAVTACLALHFIMIHLIRAIKTVWRRRCSSAYCVTLIPLKRIWKWYLKENEMMKCWLGTLVLALLSCWTAICISTLLCRVTLQFLLSFSAQKNFDVTFTSTSKIVFSQKLKPLHRVATAYQYVLTLSDGTRCVSQHKLKMMQHFCHLPHL